jgi:6-phosphogluconolactonase
MDIIIFPSATDLFQAAVEDFTQRAIDTLAHKQIFTVVLSGAKTGQLFFDSLANHDNKKIPWSKIHFFFADERYVPAHDINNNYHIAHEHLFTKIKIPAENIHRISTEFKDPKDAANQYELTLREFFHLNVHEYPKFDLIYLGVGENGHTASLMPFSDALKKSKHLAISLWVPDLNMYRITLTAHTINQSPAIIFLVTGENKKSVVKKVLEGPFLPDNYPAQMIQSVRGETIWYLDKTAGEQLCLDKN